jgi:hypothetical protein
MPSFSLLYIMPSTLCNVVFSSCTVCNVWNLNESSFPTLHYCFASFDIYNWNVQMTSLNTQPAVATHPSGFLIRFIGASFSLIVVCRCSDVWLSFLLRCCNYIVYCFFLLLICFSKTRADLRKKTYPSGYTCFALN